MTDYLRRRRMSVICNGPGSNNDSWYIIKGVLYQRSIQCGAFFCDKIIFDTFQFYFFIRYCFKTKKVHVQNKIFPYKSDLCYILFALFTLNSFKWLQFGFVDSFFSVNFFKLNSNTKCWNPHNVCVGWLFLYLLCYSTRCKCVIWLKLFDNQLSLN